jgi:hypothetical protein
MGAFAAAGRITTQTINGGINFNSAEFKRFIHRALIPRMSGEVRKVWNNFAGADLGGVLDEREGPRPMLESKTTSESVADHRWIWLE